MRRRRWTAWIVTWVAYASYYIGRKGLSVAKKALHDQLAISESTLGFIDTAYLSAYSIGQFINGLLGDRVGARRLIGAGMLLSAAACAAFGASSAAVMFGIFFCINGFAQSSGWPGTTRAMAEWTTQENRGTVMAFWATCYQVGGIVATAFASWLLRFGWRAAFYGPAIWLVVIAVVVMLLLKPGPAPQRAEGEVPLDEVAERKKVQRKILRHPTLWCYGEQEAGYVSTAFEVGGIFGVIALGIASDRLRHYSRALLSAIGLCALAAALVLYTRIGSTSVTANVIGLALIGAALFGPDALLSGAAAQDIGGRYAAATATGFVDGMGSVGSALEGLVIPAVSKHYGWNAVFTLFIVVALAGAAALIPTFRRGREVGG